MKIFRIIQNTVTPILITVLLWISYYIAIGITKGIVSIFNIHMMNISKQSSTFQKPSGSTRDERMY